MEVFAACADWLIVIGGRAMQSYGMDRMTYPNSSLSMHSGRRPGTSQPRATPWVSAAAEKP